MKKIISLLFIVICFKANSQINLATTLRQDSIIKQLKLLVAQGSGTSSASSVSVVNTPSVTVLNPTVSLLYDYSNNISGVTANITTTTATDVLASPSSSLYIYITDILVTNSSNTIGTFVKIIEETSGTILWRGYAASGGGGFSCSIRSPIKVPTLNKKVQVICETTSANVCVNISGFKAL